MKVNYNKKIERVETDHQQVLTDRCIETMEVNKNLKWQLPWFTCSTPPYNPETKTHYKGINLISLAMANYPDPRYLTFKNVQDLAKREGKDIHVKKGAKGITVFKAVQVTFGEKGEATDDEVNSSRTYWKMAYAGTVFNASQIEGIEPLQARANTVEPHAEVEAMSKALQARTGLVVEHSEVGRAYYAPGEHKVHMPFPERFKDRNSYADTLLHEFGHSTGPALKRDLSGGKGSASYAKEELVAELSSVFVAAELGLPHNPSSHENHAAYLESWLGALKNDKTFIFKAAGQASKACEFQMEHLREYKAELLVEKLTDKMKLPSKEQELKMTM